MDEGIHTFRCQFTALKVDCYDRIVVLTPLIDQQFIGSIV